MITGGREAHPAALAALLSAAQISFMAVDLAWMSVGSDLVPLPARYTARTCEGNLFRAILEGAITKAWRLADGLADTRCKPGGPGYASALAEQIADLRAWAMGHESACSLEMVCEVLEAESGEAMSPDAVGQGILRILDGLASRPKETVASLARTHGLLAGTLRKRVRQGWPIETAVTLAPNRGNRVGGRSALAA